MNDITIPVTGEVAKMSAEIIPHNGVKKDVKVTCSFCKAVKNKSNPVIQNTDENGVVTASICYICSKKFAEMIK